MKVLDYITRMMGYVAIGLLLLLMMLTVTDVFMRFAFNSPITGTMEMAQLLMTSLALGVAWCGIKERHIVVDMLMNRFSKRVQAIVDAFTLLLGLFIWGVITWTTIAQSLWEKKLRYIVGVTVEWPSYPFWWIYAFGCAILCVVIAALIVQRVKGAIKG